MNRRTIDILFFLIVFAVSFNVIPRPLQLNFIGSSFGGQLMLYPFWLGIIYTLYCQYKTKNIFAHWNQVAIYMATTIGLTFVSLILGLINFPYYETIQSSPVNQVERMSVLLSFLEKFSISPNVEFLTITWYVTRSIKGVFQSLLYTVGLSYLIFCWYHNYWKDALKVAFLAVLCVFVIMGLYAPIEILHQFQYPWATQLLTMINPILHDIESNNTWWPPLIWDKVQIRSIFAEPSYLGIYGAFVMPMIWYLFFIAKRPFLKLLSFVMILSLSMLLFLAQARTSTILLIGQVFLLTVLLSFLQKKELMLKGGGIVIGIVVSFFLSNLMIANINNVRTSSLAEVEVTTENFTNYVENNIVSAVKANERSNNARFGIMLADIGIGLDHPIWGVGEGLRNAYIPDYIPNSSRNNAEIKMWVNNMKTKGILKSGFPKLGEYTSKFSQNGFVGLVVFFLPAVILFLRAIKIMRTAKGRDGLVYGMMIVSLLSMLASGIGESLNTVMGYWIVLGIGYAMCFGNLERK